MAGFLGIFDNISDFGEAKKPIKRQIDKKRSYSVSDKSCKSDKRISARSLRLARQVSVTAATTLIPIRVTASPTVRRIIANLARRIQAVTKDLSARIRLTRLKSAETLLSNADPMFQQDQMVQMARDLCLIG